MKWLVYFSGYSWLFPGYTALRCNPSPDAQRPDSLDAYSICASVTTPKVVALFSYPGYTALRCNPSPDAQRPDSLDAYSICASATTPKVVALSRTIYQIVLQLPESTQARDLRSAVGRRRACPRGNPRMIFSGALQARDRRSSVVFNDSAFLAFPGGCGYASRCYQSFPKMAEPRHAV